MINVIFGPNLINFIFSSIIFNATFVVFYLRNHFLRWLCSTCSNFFDRWCCCSDCCYSFEWAGRSVWIIWASQIPHVIFNLIRKRFWPKHSFSFTVLQDFVYPIVCCLRISVRSGCIFSFIFECRIKWFFWRTCIKCVSCNFGIGVLRDWFK